MTNLLAHKKKWDYTSEEELTKIYQDQYNDVFSKILLLNSTQFMNVLEKQIITYLYINKKQPILSLLTRITEYFIQKYYEDKEKAYEAYQIIKETNINDLEFLDKFNCYLHCPNTGEAFHTCGNKFILCNDLIFCLQCKKVYNEEHAKMFCDYCKAEYYTKLREVENEENEKFFPVCFENPHCPNENEEKIKCKNCKEDLYVDVSEFKNGNKNDKNKKIENLYCLKCKKNFKIKEIDSKCSKCNKKFHSDIKIYNEFNNIRTDYLCLVHTLLKGKYAFPKNIKKRCKCESLTLKKFKHNLDKGILLEGIRYGKKVIICNKCFKIFNYSTFNWNCPECGIILNGSNNLLCKELSDSSSVSYKIEKEKCNAKQLSKYNTAASGIKTKNIFSNGNKSEIKNGKIVNNNNDKKNIEQNEINNSKILRNSQKANFTDRRSNLLNANNTYDKENKQNSNNTKENRSNIYNININNNINNNINKNKDNKKLFNKVYFNEDNQLINSTEKDGQMNNLLINNINNSIKLKNNFNSNNNQGGIITFNENNIKEKNDSNNNNLNNKSTIIGKSLENSKIFSPNNKNEKIDFSLRYDNKDNKGENNIQNSKEKIISIDIIKNDNKLKRSYNYANINEQKNAITKGNSKNKRKHFKYGEINETNINNNNSNNNNFNKRRISNREHITQNENNDINNNLIKIDLEKSNNNILATAKSSINIHTTSNNIINNNLKNNYINNRQNLKVINEQNIKSPQKEINNNNINKKQNEFSKQEIIKRNYSTDKNKKQKEDNNNQNNNKYISRRNQKNSVETNNNISNNKQKLNNNDNFDNTAHEDIKNNNILKKNQSLNLIIPKNSSSLSKRNINKDKINDNINEENHKNSGEQIIQRNKGSPNHKIIDIVQTKNNNKNINKNIQNINVKLSHDLNNLKNNPLNRSQNGKEIKENNIKENTPVNKSMHLVHSITKEEKSNITKNINNNNNLNKNKKKRIDNIYKTNNNNSIGIIQQEDNEDDNSFDYNVVKSINYSSNKKNKDLNQSQSSQQKNKLVENRYNIFNENNQIINESNIYIHDEKEEDKEKEKEKIKEKSKEKVKEKSKEKVKEKSKEKINEKSKEKEKVKEKSKEKDKEKNGDSSSKQKNINLYKKNNSEDIEKNKLYANNKESNKNINLNINDSSKNISSQGYQFNSDNYNIVHLLGEGTFGKIYLVEDPSDSKKYALKKIAVSDMEELSENKKEFELLMKLSQENPNLNVVKIYGIQIKKLDKFNLVMYVLMEAAQCDWENEIRNRNQYQAYYTEEELMKILTNLTSTLASLQNLGICHRDVKPQNIVCFGKDDYKLADFGEAKKKKKRKINGNLIYDFEGDTSKQTVRGTELYMSPLLFKALHDCPEVDLEYNAYKSDVFSLGLCMLLSSTLGFQALYDIRELYDNSKVKKIVEKYLSSRYSKDYIKLITSMLQIKEKNRPDFIELETFIDNDYYHKKEDSNKSKNNNQ